MWPARAGWERSTPSASAASASTGVLRGTWEEKLHRPLPGGSPCCRRSTASANLPTQDRCLLAPWGDCLAWSLLKGCRTEALHCCKALTLTLAMHRGADGKPVDEC